MTDAETGQSIPGATILVFGTDFGTITDQQGSYTLRLPSGRYALRVSFVGYEPVVDSVSVTRAQVTTFNVSLRESRIELDELTVEAALAAREAGEYQLSPQDLQNMPGPFRDGFSAIKVLPGVATNNELSNQYSVRGGGFNENLIYINGFEIFKPLRVRQGEQEGLGLLNPELADRIAFYAGGFPVRYGGKLSSVLDVRYRRPYATGVRGAAYVSTLDGGVVIDGATQDGRIGWVFGARKARASRFFGTQELKGQYEPDFTDLQTAVTFRLAPGHELEALGIWAEHQFFLEPSQRKTYFGTFEDLRSVWINYSGDENDGHTTRLGGIRLKNALSSSLRVEHEFSYFEINEFERFDISGSATLYRVDPHQGDPDTGSGHIPTGHVRQHDRADNAVDMASATVQGRGILHYDRVAYEGGWLFRHLTFSDRIFEESAIAGFTREGEPVRVVVDSLRDASSFTSSMAGGYAQTTIDALPERDRLLVTAGLRVDYFEFNREWTFSPRVSTRYRLSPNTSLMGAAGLFYQAPTYREFRGEIDAAGTIQGAINRHLRSQRALQFVGGIERFLPQYRLYFRGEAYYKHLTDLISYSVDNVRLTYSGENDAHGYVTGVDFQVKGEFVPGLESWVNYSYMIAREEFHPAFIDRFRNGTLPRPTDQRHTFSAFVQDYIPGDDTWKIHLRLLFGTGLPYTPPAPGERIGGVTLQIPGNRLSARYPEYKRVDMGATKSILLVEGRGGRPPVELQFTGEVLNVFDMTNTVAYSWLADAHGIWQRIPTRLTPRTYNVRMRIQF